MLRHLELIDCMDCKSPAVFCGPLKKAVMLQDYHLNVLDRFDRVSGCDLLTRSESCISSEAHRCALLTPITGKRVYLPPLSLKHFLCVLMDSDRH